MSQEKFILQLLCPCPILHEGVAGVRVPDMDDVILHLLPSQIVPAEQEAFMFASANRVGVPLIL